MTGATVGTVVTVVTVVVPGVTVVLPPVGGWLVTVVEVFGVVSVAGVSVVALASVALGLVVAVLVVTPEVVAEGLELLVCPVGFTVLLPAEVAEDESAVVEVAAAVVLAVVVG